MLRHVVGGFHRVCRSIRRPKYGILKFCSGLGRSSKNEESPTGKQELGRLCEGPKSRADSIFPTDQSSAFHDVLVNAMSDLTKPAPVEQESAPFTMEPKTNRQATGQGSVGSPPTPSATAKSLFSHQRQRNLRCYANETNAAVTVM